MKPNTASKLLIICSMLYLIIGISLGFVTAMKLIWPTIGEIEILTFGRIRSVHTNLVMFGWLLQSGMGLAFFILPKLLHTKLYSEKLGVATCCLFNIITICSATLIFAGHMKNIEYGEIPIPFDYLTVICWVMFAINIFATVINRNVKYLYVSVWYFIGAVIWTAFVYITGNIITQLPFIAGINQANLTWFYVHNAVGLVFTPMGVAIAYYVIPKTLNTPLYSHKLSLVGFWVIAFVYVWTGAHHMIFGPISYWLQTVAILFSWSLIIPVVAVITNFLGTYLATPKEKRYLGPIAKFMYMGTIFYLLTCLQGPFQSIRTVNIITSKNDWVVGHAHMALLGAFSYFAVGGVYHVLPRIIGRKLYSEKLGDIQFWIMTTSSVLFFGILWVSGVVQGFLWQNMNGTFLEILKMMKPYHTIRFISGSLIIVGFIIFLYNIMETLWGKAQEMKDVEV